MFVRSLPTDSCWTVPLASAHPTANDVRASRVNVVHQQRPARASPVRRKDRRVSLDVRLGRFHVRPSTRLDRMARRLARPATALTGDLRGATRMAGAQPQPNRRGMPVIRRRIPHARRRATRVRRRDARARRREASDRPRTPLVRPHQPAKRPIYPTHQPQLPICCNRPTSAWCRRCGRMPFRLRCWR